MYQKVRSGFICLFLVLTAMGCQQTRPPEERAGELKLLPGFLVETEELQSLLHPPEVVIVDARSDQKYQIAHIPNAVNIPKTLFRAPEDMEYKKAHGFAIAPEKAEKVFGEAGISAESRVIVYDSITFPDASIIWALLKYYGHDHVQVLKGGFERWDLEGRPVTQAQPIVRKGTFKARPRPEMVATTDWITSHKEKITILDMRTFAEYLGVDPAGNKRGGSVPGAINVEWVEFAGDSTVKSAEEIAEVFERYGIPKDREVVTYCNIGIGRSTYGFMLLKMLGYEKVRVYGGSMEDWSADPDELPMGGVTNIPANL